MLVQAAPSDNRRNRIYETRPGHSWVQCEADGGIAPARERVCWKEDNSSLSAKWLPDPWELVCVFFRWPDPRALAVTGGFAGPCKLTPVTNPQRTQFSSLARLPKGF